LSYTRAAPLTYVSQALAPSHEKLQTRHTLLERLRGIIRSTGDRFDVKDVSMLNYAEDLEIAPMDLVIIVRTVIHFTLGLRSVNDAPVSSNTYRIVDAL
jgi:hypothetical protein